MVDQFCLIRKILSSSNGCGLIKHGHHFVKLRKYLCFCLEKNFQLNRKDFFSEINTKCPKKQLNQRLFPQRDTEVRGSSIFASNNISLSSNFRKREPKVNGSNVFTHCLMDAKIRGSNVITSRNYNLNVSFDFFISNSRKEKMLKPPSQHASLSIAVCLK